MRALNELRNKLLDLVAQFDAEARTEVIKFLKKYPSDTPYKINLITVDDISTEYLDAPLNFDEIPEVVATYFVFANFMLKYNPDAPQPDRVELSYNYGKHVVVYEPHFYRLYYKINDDLFGYKS